MSKPTESLKAYWRSLDDHEALRAGVERPVSHDEFPGQELSTIKVGRRGFVGILGASTALAGLTTGCLRKPVERILPFAKRPEDLIPGEPVFYASAYQVGGSVLGVLVESQDGRPTKIEGNPKHSASQGATDGWTQAAVLNLYDPERTQAPMKRGDAGLVPAGDAETGAWQDAKAGVDAILAKTKGAGGQGVALVLPWTLSPTLRAQTQAFLKAYPKARVFLDDATAPVNAAAALEMLSDRGVRATYHLDTARVVVAVDSDFLATEQDHVRLAREFARLRSPLKPTDGMNRLYAVGPHFTVTGGAADHRLRLRGGQVGLFLIGLAQALAAAGVQMPAELVGVLKGADLGEQASKFTAALAKDLIAARAARGEGSAILVGERQPAWVHGLGLAINNALGNANNTLRLRHDDAALATEDLAALAAGLSGGAISTVLCLGTNPAHDAPGELKLAELLGKAEVVHVGSHVDETAALAAWHLPLSHALEGWGDLEASDGTISICQPLIRPLFDSKSAVEVLAWWASGSLSDDENSSLYLVQGTWRELLGTQFSERRWQQWLHDGVVSGIPRSGVTPMLLGWGKLADAVSRGVGALVNEGFEVNFHLDPKLADGRFANNAWMQELPHPMSKLAWDNAAYLSPATAKELGVQNCDLLSVQVGDRSVKAPVWIIPGQADKTVSIDLGNGRPFGIIAKGAGFDAYPLQAAANPWFVGGAAVSKAGGQHLIYSTQDHGTLDPGLGYEKRPIVRETTLEGFAKDPAFSQKGDLMKPEDLKSLWDHNEGDIGAPKLVGKQQWGLVIDLNRCTGCNACVVACQAENNIPVVGKKEVGNGREMHWMRLDRYYSGMDVADPEVVIQPMLCQHCETAPCENVCPVAATSHSPEGLNDMTYNRCIGTRYCANNCPYKVRRFNFHNYNLRVEEDMQQSPLIQMVRNPDVTVRFRGVIEKCSYCVQRINQAKIAAHVAGKDTVEDGGVVTACQQVCPSEALTFGDIADPTTRVAKLRAGARNYGVLTDLLTRPRTTYLGRVRNPNPELA
jgi:Fe-S-cluster-containing dehydrogenase component